jgi:diguanylate cyclase (GGDEF)-like protein
VASVRDLPPSEARKEYPVRIRAVITYVNVANGELFVQDESAGIFVFVRNSTYSAPIEWGQLVEVNGVSAPGDFSSSITKAEIKVHGRTAMPKPLRLTLDTLHTGSEDSQWGQLKGVVRSGRENNGVLSLNVAATGGAFLVLMREYPADWATQLIDARVTLAGVLAAAFNEHRQAVGVRMFVPSAKFINVDDPAPASPFDLPVSSAVSVGAFRTNTDESRRIRVRGTVTAAVSASLIYVSDGEGNLQVEMDRPVSARPGELIDVVGFPESVDGRPGLKNAIWRLVARGRDLAPQHVAASDILTPPDQNAGSGITIAAGTRFDLKLVAVEGTLLQQGEGSHARTITLTSLDRIFIATIPDSAQQIADELEIGSHLKLTGVCLVTYDEYRQAQSFRLLIRRTDDIAVLSRPPWLTLRHSVWIIGIMLLSVIAATTWIKVLRDQVAVRTEELRDANDRLGRMATEDGLTGAANRRRFDEALGNEVSRAGRTGTPVSLVMIDIDHFKALNDSYGHQTGDRCLIGVVGAIRAAFCRAGEVVARYGGEEFAVILPNVGDETAIARAEAVRLAVLNLEIPHAGAPGNRGLSVSLGVGTLWPGSACSADDLVRFADRALYQAKQSGRNRVVSWGAVAVAL